MHSGTFESSLVGYVDYTKDLYCHYIVLELMEGDLRAYLDSEPDSSYSVKLCKDLFLGIQFLHSKEILHRDLKPGNILYKLDPLCLKIADFGLSSTCDKLSEVSDSVMHTNAGTRLWMAPELMIQTSSKGMQDTHSKNSDMFSCGLILHYILSSKKHPFAPPSSDCNDQSLKVQNETEANIYNYNPSISKILPPEASDLVERLIAKNKDDRISAADALTRPFFWTNNKKQQFIQAVGDQPEIETPRSKRPSGVRTQVENDLETSFVKHFHGDWDVPVPAIFREMTSGPYRTYDTKSCVELLRFIRNTYAHSSHDRGKPRPAWFEDALFKDYVFFRQFPWLVTEVYNIVMKGGWNISREKVKASLQED